MKKLLLLLLIFLTLSAVSAGNNTTDIPNPTYHIENTSTVIALESGDSNISFSDNYKGYCIEWGEHSAEKNDAFYVDDFKIINKITGEDVSNHIKTFFVYFYENATKNPVVTQHIIWKFTNNKEFSQFRANKELYYAILDKSSTIIVPNTGVLKINDTIEMVYDFRVFKARFLEYQDYLGFNIFFRNITNNNTTYNNTNTTLFNNTIMNITYSSKYNVIETINKEKLIQKKENNNNYISNMHNTGHGLWLFVLILILLIIGLKNIKLT